MTNGIKQSTPDYGACSPNEVYLMANTNPDGLTDEQVQEKEKKFGLNKIIKEKKESVVLRFLKNFSSLMAILLWICGVIAFYSGMPQLGIAIWLVNVVNGLFSFIQEYRANRATEALNRMLPNYARVIRNRREVKILSEQLVPGDIMLIEEGDAISADGRVVSSTDLKINQSALTGESNPVRKNNQAVDSKNISLLNYTNTVFAGTTVSSGDAKVVVLKTGMDTEFGKIDELTQSVKEEKSPLQKELDKMTKEISFIAISIGLLFFLVSIFLVKEPVAKSFIFSIGIIVAFIPEGLLPTVTLSLAMAVQRMAKQHALVKKLSSVETLGETTVICSDKTGTLTKNEMTVNHIWTPNGEYTVTGEGYSSDGKIIIEDSPSSNVNEKDLGFLLKCATLCSNAKILKSTAENLKFSVLGDPTEACLSVVAEKFGINLDENKLWAKRLKEFPFDSERKRMSTIHQLTKLIYGTNLISITKGAPKEVVELCHYSLQNGTISELNEESRKKILEANDQYARKGYRVLAVAYRDLKESFASQNSINDSTSESIENNLIFQGLMIMSDPPREFVEESIAKCHNGKIRIIMMTGDYELTALSIAKKIGVVLGENPRVVTGKELESLSDDELKDILKNEVLFARVAPEQKYRIVSNLQEMGHIVAVTGDGVNDAPSLKKADIGVAMGISGTDVAKEAADMILTDDNFSSIVSAIEQGRAVYSNIQKFLTYIFCGNMAEATPLLVFLLSKARIPLPLTVMQILTIDLGTDMVPALGLGVEPAESGVMNRPPREKTITLLNKNLLIKSFLWYGGLESMLSMGAFFFTFLVSNVGLNNMSSNGLVYHQATTMALGGIIFSQVGMVMNSRTVRSSIVNFKLFANKTINLGIVIEIILFALLCYVPILQSVFNTAPIGLKDWLYLLLCPLIIIIFEESRKWYIRKYYKTDNLTFKI